MRKLPCTVKLSLVATMMVFLLLGCSTSTQSPPASSVASGGKPSGSFIIAWSKALNNIDPPMGSVTDYPGATAAIYDSLIRISPEQREVPQLMERWEISDDGLTHTYVIRKGVKFHDGSDLTAADVKFSLERPLAPGFKSAHTAAPTWQALAPQVEQKDDYTVVVRYKTPQFEVPRSIADNMGLLAVVPKKYIEEKGVDYFARNPVGSGPFKFVKYDIGARLELEANENYWDTTQIPKFKNLTILLVPEESTRVAMLKTGEVDIADVSTESAPALKTAGLRIKNWDGGQQTMFVPLYDIKNPAQYAFSNLGVRKAMLLSIDRKEMADKLFGGYAQPAPSISAVSPSMDFFDANQLKADPYDAEGAKKLLAEAGYPNGFNTKVWDVGEGGILSTFVQALAGYWRKVGINASTEPMQSTALITIVRTYSDPRVWNTVWVSGIGGTVSPGAARFEISGTFHTTKGTFRNHTNKKLDELIDAYPMTKDPAARKKIALDATIMAKNGYSAPAVMMVDSVWALGSKIGDFTPNKGRPFIGDTFWTVSHGK